MHFHLHIKQSKLSDSELIEKYKHSNDANYVGELFQQYTHLVFGMCMKYFKNTPDSEDAVMEIFEKLLTDLKRHDIKNFKSWLYSVTKNHCLMQFRKDKRDTIKNAAEPMEFSYEMHLNDEPVKEEQLNKLEQAIEQLSVEQKRCVELFYLQEKSYNEVAKLTGYSLKQVKSYLQNGKRNIKSLIIE